MWKLRGRDKEETNRTGNGWDGGRHWSSTFAKASAFAYAMADRLADKSANGHRSSVIAQRSSAFAKALADKSANGHRRIND